MTKQLREVSLSPPGTSVSDGIRTTEPKVPTIYLDDEVKDLVTRLKASPRTTILRAQQLDLCIKALRNLTSAHTVIPGERYTLRQLAILWAKTELDRPAVWDPEQQRPMPAFVPTERKWLKLGQKGCKWQRIVTSFADFLPCALTENFNYIVPAPTVRWYLTPDANDANGPEFQWIRQLRQYFRDYNLAIYRNTTFPDVIRGMVCEYLWVFGEDQARAIAKSWAEYGVWNKTEDEPDKAETDKCLSRPAKGKDKTREAGTDKRLSRPAKGKDKNKEAGTDKCLSRPVDRHGDCKLSTETIRISNTVSIDSFYPGRVIRVQTYHLKHVTTISRDAGYFTRLPDEVGMGGAGMKKFLNGKYFNAFQKHGGSKKYCSFTDKVNQLMTKTKHPHMPLLHVRPMTAGQARNWDFHYNAGLNSDTVPYWLVCFYKPDGTPMWDTEQEQSLSSVWENCTKKGGWKAHRR